MPNFQKTPPFNKFTAPKFVLWFLAVAVFTFLLSYRSLYFPPNGGGNVYTQNGGQTAVGGLTTLSVETARGQIVTNGEIGDLCDWFRAFEENRNNVLKGSIETNGGELSPSVFPTLGEMYNLGAETLKDNGYVALAETFSAYGQSFAPDADNGTRQRNMEGTIVFPSGEVDTKSKTTMDELKRSCLIRSFK